MRTLIRLSLVSLVLLAGAASAQTRDWSRAAPAEVDVWNFKFDPDAVSLQAGQPYVLHLVNQSDNRHDFTAKAFFAAAAVAPEDRAAIVDGKIELPPNQSRDVHLVAPAAGAYEAHCSQFLHAHLGMKTGILVH